MSGPSVRFGVDLHCLFQRRDAWVSAFGRRLQTVAGLPPADFRAEVRMPDEQIYTTTDAGAPVASDEHSLTVGAGGPIVLHDHYLIEQMAQFNRERIPERQPHAKGSGAFGVFEVTADVSAYTCASVFQPGDRPRWLRDSRLSPVSVAAPTPGEIPVVSPSSSTPTRVCTTWSETTPRCSSSRTRSSSSTSSGHRSDGLTTISATTTCSGTSGLFPRSRRTR